LRLSAYKKGADDAASGGKPAARGAGPKGTRAAIINLVAARRGQSGIIYALSRKACESLADHLRRRGVRAAAYHAGMEPAARNGAQDAFARDELEVVVATIAFGMGIDKSNVRYVIHRDMPRSIEAYYQEIGRAGRDGLASDCILLYSWADVVSHERLQDTIEDEHVRREARAKTRAMFDLADAAGCRQANLVAYFDETIAACGTSCDVCRGTRFI